MSYRIGCAVRSACRDLVARGFTTTACARSGHNKWSTIKHTKFANDAAKNKIANKFSRLIVATAKIGGPDPSKNARLAGIIETAKKASVTKKIIESALRRAAGLSNEDGKVLESVVYEASGPNGLTLVIEALTDSKARTFTAVRLCLSKAGYQLGPALFCFDRKGVIRIKERAAQEGAETKTEIESDDIFEHAIEAGAEDIEETENYEADGDEPERVYELICESSETAKVAEQMKETYGYEISEMGIEYIPKQEAVVELNDEQGKSLGKLLATLDDLDDIQDVYTNAR